ncbi:hypothetical protein H0H87_000452 [Tephrocybe sp. NHM501043]|nr:hypothetical protein H0H87_000452 [Tephrocybe sp. NHM501043]
MRPLLPIVHNPLFNSQPKSWLTLASLSFRRHRSGFSKKRKSKQVQEPYNKPFEHFRTPSPRLDVSKREKFSALWSHTRKTKSDGQSYYKLPPVDPNNIPPFFEAEVEQWSKSPQLLTRLVSFGLPEYEITPLVKAFVTAVKSGQLSTPEGHEKYILDRFALHTREGDPIHAVDVIYTTIIFVWAAEPAQSALLHSVGVQPLTIKKIQALAQAGARHFPAEDFPSARAMRRKVIMHVGPTNSGKTHNALRALAAAPQGAYAGPLRLLAHEIWERLNTGQIVPLGMKEEPAKSLTLDTDTDTAVDMRPAPKRGNPKYVRACNMITGEEQRIVEDNATLLSCTVEMMKPFVHYDVAVIDEIQMIADESRGSAWTAAVLGTCAKELHLCGEETAVSLVQELLKDTGDEIIVKRYQRLSPLRLEENTLGGDLSQVKKGDCIVTFSRSNVYGIKRRIETTTPFRCAIVYGRLPPEIRSEQAALFNDPNSGFDIMIGSDAIGMGLNLKIGRIIFESTSKFNGVRDVPLSFSQTKQIAGRAGRYGLHGSSNPGGSVTAFLPKDIPHIQKALDAPPVPLSSARVGMTKSSFMEFYLALPSDAPTKTILDAHQYISMMPAHIRQEHIAKSRNDKLCEFIDKDAFNLPITDRQLCINAPIPHSDIDGMELITKFVKAYKTKFVVNLWEELEGSPLVATLELIESRMRNKIHEVHTTAISHIESLHKAAVLYIWMSYRRPLSWNCYEEVAVLKDRAEKALDWSLQALTQSQPGFRRQQDWREQLESQRKERGRDVAYKPYFGTSTRKGISQLGEEATQAANKPLRAAV